MMKRTIALLLAIAMMACLFAGCGEKKETGTVASVKEEPTEVKEETQSETVPEKKETSNGPKIVTVATTGVLNTSNCYLVSGRAQQFYAYNVFGQLVYFDGQNQIHPELLESWDISEDGCVYTLHFRKNIVWHDGEPFTSDDYIFSWELGSNPNLTTYMTRSFLAYAVGCDDSGLRIADEEAGWKKIDDYTVELTLKMPVGENVALTYQPWIVPKHILEKEDPTKVESWSFWESPVGCGPFIFDSIIAGEQITMKKNENWCLGEEDVDVLIYKTFVESDLLPGLMSGEIDILGGNGACSLPLTDYDLAQEQDNLTIVRCNLGSYQYLPIELNFDYLQDPRVRKAFEMALDKQYMLDTFNMGFGEVLSSPFPSTCKYIDPSLQQSYDPEAARALLEEAGWDFDRVLKMACNAERGGSQGGIPVLVQQMLGEIGVKVELVQVEYTTMMSQLHEGGYYDLSVMGGLCDVKRPYFLSSQYNPDVYWQWSHLKDTKFLDVFDSTLYMTDENEIAQAYQKFQQMQLDDPVYIWLFEKDDIIVYNNQKLSNVDVPNSGDSMWQAWDWVVNY